jgi:hypothetical protein
MEEGWGSEQTKQDLKEDLDLSVVAPPHTFREKAKGCGDIHLDTASSD